MVKLNMDSLMHASWNPSKATQGLSGVEGGQVSKFKDRYGEIDGLEDLLTGTPIKDSVLLIKKAGETKKGGAKKKK